MFGDRLKKIREDKNLLQKELGNELGVTSQTVSGWEIDRTRPDYDTLIKIANFFDVSIDYLLGNEKKGGEYETEIKEKEALKSLLIKNGFMNNEEDLTNEEYERLMAFVKQNKNFIKEIR